MSKKRSNKRNKSIKRNKSYKKIPSKKTRSKKRKTKRIVGGSRNRSALNSNPRTISANRVYGSEEFPANWIDYNSDPEGENYAIEDAEEIAWHLGQYSRRDPESGAGNRGGQCLWRHGRCMNDGGGKLNETGCECPKSYPKCAKSGKNKGWCYNDDWESWYGKAWSYIPWRTGKTCGSAMGGENCAYDFGELGGKQQRVFFNRANVKEIPMLDEGYTPMASQRQRTGNPLTKTHSVSSDYTL